MKIAHNQTNPRWLEGYDTNTSGIGVFLVPDVQKPEGIPLKMEVQQNLTYPECVRRAEFAAAFKWIPDKMSNSLFDEKGAVISVDCRDALCTDWCTETLCWCLGGICRSMI